MKLRPMFFVFISALLLNFPLTQAGIRNKSVSGDDDMSPTARDNSDPSMTSQDPEAKVADESADELEKAKQAIKSSADDDESKHEKAKKNDKKYYRRAEGFLAGPDWEFDGFVSGGQDMEQKSMFSTHDLLYLNIGSSQGLATGDRLGIYRRGDRVRDPQTGKVIGFEVRKVAIGELTDRIDKANCTLRIVKSYEAVEVGDLVRKEE